MKNEEVKTTIFGIKTSWIVRQESIEYIEKFGHELMRRLVNEIEVAIKEECGIAPLPIEIILATEETLDAMRWIKNQDTEWVKDE